MHSQEFINEMKSVLEARAIELKAEIDSINPHEYLGESLDEQALEEEDNDINQALLKHAQDELVKVNGALGRIKNNNYGVTSTGEVIPEDRLRAIPWADTAV